MSDEANPRSLGFQVATLADHVEKLPARDDIDRHSLEQRLALKILTAVRLAPVETLMVPKASGRREGLTDLLNTVSSDLLDLSEALTAKYLTHLTISRLMASS